MKRNYNEFEIPKEITRDDMAKMSQEEIVEYNKECSIVRKAAEDKITPNLLIALLYYNESKRYGTKEDMEKYAHYKNDAKYCEYLKSVIRECKKRQLHCFV